MAGGAAVRPVLRLRYDHPNDEDLSIEDPAALSAQDDKFIRKLGLLWIYGLADIVSFSLLSQVVEDGAVGEWRAGEGERQNGESQETEP
jgi:hypothetical protein